MAAAVDYLNGLVWSNGLIYLALGAGIYFTIVTRFMQIRHLKEMIKLLFGSKSSKSGVSSFQAFSLAISGRVGTGNIAGVATAIAMGGPGAVFWMWAIAFLGAGSAYVESTLAQIYKTEVDGQYRGGPSYYIEKGLGIKWFAIVFSVATVIAMGLLLPGVQANSIAAGIENAFGVSTSITGIVIIVLLGMIIFGGIKRISKTAEMMVPFMAIGYLAVALIIVGLNITAVPAAFVLIFKSAFGAEPIFGGILGMAISWGIKRGIYSNEAGQGTAPHAAGAAEVSHPAKQGLVQAFSVYVDTLLVATATAIMIIITGMYNVADPATSGSFLVNTLPGIEAGPIFTQRAVETVFPAFGAPFVALALFFFAFTTIMAYYYYAETNIAYLFKVGKNRTIVINVLRVVILGSTFYGAIKTASLAWGLGDLGVGIMAWLNFIAILLIHKPALKVLKDYEEQKAQGLDPQFDAEKVGIKNAEFWTNNSSKKNEKETA